MEWYPRSSFYKYILWLVHKTIQIPYLTWDLQQPYDVDLATLLFFSYMGCGDWGLFAYMKIHTALHL